jgi:hypothetical protein
MGSKCYMHLHSSDRGVPSQHENAISESLQIILSEQYDVW